MYDANRITILLHSQDSVNETRVLYFIHTKKRNSHGRIVKVHCSLRLSDKIEEIGRNEANIEWS